MELTPLEDAQLIGRVAGGKAPVADRADLERRVAGLFEQHLNVSVPTPETDLFEIGALDSLAFVDLLLRLEQAFGVRATTDDLDIDNFRSIARIAEFVSRRHGVDGPDEGSTAEPAYRASSRRAAPECAG